MLIKWNGTYPPDTCEKCGETMAQDYGSLIRKGEHEVVFLCNGCDTRRVGTGNGSYLPMELANLSYEELFLEEKGWAIVPFEQLVESENYDIDQRGIIRLFDPKLKDVIGVLTIVVGIVAFGFILMVAEGVR